MFSRSTIFTAAILSTSAAAYNNGQWNPAEYGSGAYTAESNESPASSPATPAASNIVDYTPSVTSALTAPAAPAAPNNVDYSPIVTSAPAAQPHYQGDWQYSVTWPAGCSTWANPCPSGAHVAGSDDELYSGYTNAFTSYLTQTNSNGVITGMPAVATLPAGVSAHVAEISTMQTSFVAPSSSAYTYSNASTKSAIASWSSGEESTQASAATVHTAMRCSALLLMTAVAVSLFY